MSEADRMVTGIVALDKKKCKIFLNDEFAFVLYKGELRSLEIEVGERLTPVSYDRIQNEILPKRAKLRAMNLLRTRDYTEKQLHDKLRQGLYPAPVIEQAVDYVKAFRYVDDVRYAKDYIACHGAERPVKRLENDLQKKGISKEIIDQALRDYMESSDVANERQIIQNVLQKKKFDPREVSWAEKQKMCAALMRKGFQFENIRSVLLLDIT